MPRPGTHTPPRCSRPSRCPIRRRNVIGSCSRATFHRRCTRRRAARFTRAVRTLRRTIAVARSRPRCARWRRASSPPATSPRSRSDAGRRRSPRRHAFRRPVLGSVGRAPGRPGDPLVDPLGSAAGVDAGRLRRLQLAGVASGFAAGAWLGAAEAPTKMVTLGLSPVVISLTMVLGVFLARWSLPALLRGTAAIGADVRQAPHLVVWAVLAGCLWAVANTLTGMNPLAFVTFFTVGEVGMMTALALADRGGLGPLTAELAGARDVLFWLLVGGFVWVVGDLFQQYAAKYIGISRGIPLSNTNQLWGLAWGLLVFGELHGRSGTTHGQVIGGSLLMALGAAAIALASATGTEHRHWQEAAEREGARYAVDPASVRGALAGEPRPAQPRPRTRLDWTLVVGATAVFVAFGSIARVPELAVSWGWVGGLVVVLLTLLVGTGLFLWRTTRFS